MTNIPMGTIVAYALSKTNRLPSGWLFCDGSSIPAQYEELIQLLGSETTPNLCGRTLIGAGQPINGKQTDGRDPSFPKGYSLEVQDTGGEYVHQLTEAEMPSHGHTINHGDFGYHRRSYEGSNQGSDVPYETHPSHNISGTDGTGGNKPHYNMPPYYAVHYIIYAGGD